MLSLLTFFLSLAVAGKTIEDYFVCWWDYGYSQNITIRECRSGSRYEFKIYRDFYSGFYSFFSWIKLSPRSSNECRQDNAQGALGF